MPAGVWIQTLRCMELALARHIVVHQWGGSQGPWWLLQCCLEAEVPLVVQVGWRGDVHLARLARCELHVVFRCSFGLR